MSDSESATVDLGKDFPLAVKRIIALKTRKAGWVTMEAAPSKWIDYFRSCNVLVRHIWKITLDDTVKRPELEGLMGFAETFDRADPLQPSRRPSYSLYAFSDEDGYNVTFVCRAGNGADFSGDANALFDLFDGVVHHPECRGTHKPLLVDDMFAALVDEDDEDEDSPDYDKIAALVDRQIEAMWPEHLRNIAESFWAFLRSPFDSLSTDVSPRFLFTETPEARASRERMEETLAMAFYRDVDRSRQSLLANRPQVR